MVLVSLADVRSLLTCPRCGSALEDFDGCLRCAAERCPCGAPGGLPLVGRWPVLVDFERSILARENLESVQDRAPAARASARGLTVDRLPRPLRSLLRPRNLAAARNVELMLSMLAVPAPLVLVIGGGTVGNGVERLYADPRTRVLGLDIYASPLTQLIADAHQLPLADSSVDAVVIQAVLEHVLDPGQVVREIHRVLRPRGLVYAETPFLQQVHAGAYDFTRFTASGHRYLFRAFEEIAAGPVAGPGTQLLWSVDHLVRGLTRSQLAGRVARVAFAWLRQLDGLVPAEFAMDSASAYFFLGRRAHREITPREIMHYYRGAQRTDHERP